MALIIKTKGEDISVKPKAGSKFSLEELQEVVHGYIEPVRLNLGRTMLVNEEGKLEGFEINAKATNLAYLFGNIGNDVIVGDVIVLTDDEW